MVILEEVSGYVRVNALEADDCAAVAMVIQGVIRIRRVEAVVDCGGIVVEGIAGDYWADVNGWVGWGVRIDRVAVDINAAALACDITCEDIFCNRGRRHIITKDSSAAAVPVDLLQVPAYRTPGPCAACYCETGED